MLPTADPSAAPGTRHFMWGQLEPRPLCCVADAEHQARGQQAGVSLGTEEESVEHSDQMTFHLTTGGSRLSVQFPNPKADPAPPLNMARTCWFTLGRAVGLGQASVGKHVSGRYTGHTDRQDLSTHFHGWSLPLLDVQRISLGRTHCEKFKARSSGFW